MAKKNTAEVLINGKIYTISGYESTAYLQKVAVYLNEMEDKVSQMEGYRRLGSEEKQLLKNMNLADEYFKAYDAKEQLEKELEKLTGLTVKAGNDANVAALGEMWKGGGAGYHNVVMVTLGTGVGGGIIVNGKIVTGTHGAGGEIGHVHVEDDEHESCNCGNQGCLEQYASATGIVRLANRMLAATDKPSVLRNEEVTAKSVFDAVKAGDELAMEVAEKFGKYLGTALAVVAGVVDPEVYVIGGGVSKAGKIILDYIEKYYKKYVFQGSRDCAFALAELGNDAGICGAAKLVLG